MTAHLFDHFVFTSRRWSERTKWIVFGVFTFGIVANFWWFRGLAFGVDGPIKDYWGVLWREVSVFLKSPIPFLERTQRRSVDVVTLLPSEIFINLLLTIFQSIFSHRVGTSTKTTRDCVCLMHVLETLPCPFYFLLLSVPCPHCGMSHT